MCIRDRVRPATVEVRFNLVRAYLQAGRITAALPAARELSATHKQDIQLHFSLGVLLASAKQYKSAQIELEQANTLQPETFEILHNLGEAYLKGHDYAKAELALDRASKLKPDSAETLYLLAQVDFEQSRPVDALDLLVRAHKLAPQDVYKRQIAIRCRISTRATALQTIFFTTKATEFFTTAPKLQV